MSVCKKVFTSFFSISLCIVLFITFSGCFDLGEIKDVEDYETKFCDIKFVKEDLSIAEKSIIDLYNDSAVNDFTKNDFVPPTDSDAYKYMAVFAGEDVNIKEFALYVKAESEEKFCINVFVADKLPTIIATGVEADDTETITDPDTGTETSVIKTFDEPKGTNAVANITLSVKNNSWTSFSITSWKQGETRANSITLKKDQCLLFQFENNCVFYEGNTKAKNELTKTKVCFTAMLIYVK